jgi:transposase
LGRRFGTARRGVVDKQVGSCPALSCGFATGGAGVEPTNNAAERALRHAVIWRRTSGGTDSEGGSRFVERMLSAVATCRQQKRNVLEYMTRCHRARLLGTEAPSLLAVEGTTALVG